MSELVKEMDKYKVDTCALSESRCQGKGIVIKKNYMCFIVDIKVGNIKLEQDFILVDKEWLIY